MNARINKKGLLAAVFFCPIISCCSGAWFLDDFSSDPLAGGSNQNAGLHWARTMPSSTIYWDSTNQEVVIPAKDENWVRHKWSIADGEIVTVMVRLIQEYSDSQFGVFMVKSAYRLDPIRAKDNPGMVAGIILENSGGTANNSSVTAIRIGQSSVAVNTGLNLEQGKTYTFEIFRQLNDLSFKVLDGNTILGFKNYKIQVERHEVLHLVVATLAAVHCAVEDVSVAMRPDTGYFDDFRADPFDGYPEVNKGKYWTVPYSSGSNVILWNGVEHALDFNGSAACAVKHNNAITEHEVVQASIRLNAEMTYSAFGLWLTAAPFENQRLDLQANAVGISLKQAPSGMGAGARVYIHNGASKTVQATPVIDLVNGKVYDFKIRPVGNDFELSVSCERALLGSATITSSTLAARRLYLGVGTWGSVGLSVDNVVVDMDGPDTVGNYDTFSGNPFVAGSNWVVPGFGSGCIWDSVKEAVISAAQSGIPDPDFNHDFKVDLSDLLPLLGSWLTYSAGYDLTGDSVVDLRDFSQFALFWLDDFYGSSMQICRRNVYVPDKATIAAEITLLEESNDGYYGLWLTSSPTGSEALPVQNDAVGVALCNRGGTAGDAKVSTYKGTVKTDVASDLNLIPGQKYQFQIERDGNVFNVTIKTEIGAVYSASVSDSAIAAKTLYLAIGAFSGSRISIESVDTYFSVKTFGAVGDGITNDTGALQQAFNIVGNNARVYFPEGCYYLDEYPQVPGQIGAEVAVKDNLHIFGSYPDRAILKSKPDNPSLTEENYMCIRFLECQHISMTGLALDANHKTSYGGFKFTCRSYNPTQYTRRSNDDIRAYDMFVYDGDHQEGGVDRYWFVAGYTTPNNINFYVHDNYIIHAQTELDDINGARIENNIIAIPHKAAGITWAGLGSSGECRNYTVQENIIYDPMVKAIAVYLDNNATDSFQIDNVDMLDNTVVYESDYSYVRQAAIVVGRKYLYHVSGGSNVWNNIVVSGNKVFMFERDGQVAISVNEVQWKDYGYSLVTMQNVAIDNIQTSGVGVMVVATLTNGEVYFRIFNKSGQSFSYSEASLAGRAREISNFKQYTLFHTQKRDEIVGISTLITGYTSSDPVLKVHGNAMTNVEISNNAVYGHGAQSGQTAIQILRLDGADVIGCNFKDVGIGMEIGDGVKNSVFEQNGAIDNNIAYKWYGSAGFNWFKVDNLSSGHLVDNYDFVGIQASDDVDADY